jgi:hypothetical protein
MKRTFVAAALAAAVTVGPAAGISRASDWHTPPSTPDTYVTQWDEIGSRAFTAAAMSPAEGHLIFAYMSIAVYDTAMAISGTYQPVLVDLDAPDGASPEAAVVAAAHAVLAHYYSDRPASLTILADEYPKSLATIPDGQSKTDGIALGEAVAAALIDLRKDDGFRAAVPPYVPPSPPVPGVWIPTASTPPIGAYVPGMQTFAIESADQFRPAGPPALESKKWARDYNEVKELGSSTSTTRTPEQTEAARFWGEAPVQQARGSFRRFVGDHGLDLFDAARFLGMVSVTYADAFIACFDAKYHYTFWRPITAIRAGDTDRNDATEVDTSWTPYLPATPNHPEYPSAHSCITPSAGIVASRFLGTGQVNFTVPSLAFPGVRDRTFARTKDLEYDVSNGRIWGGIHFRSAVEAGATIAKRTANYVLAHEFRRTSSCHHR